MTPLRLICWFAGFRLLVTSASHPPGTVLHVDYYPRLETETIELQITEISSVAHFGSLIQSNVLILTAAMSFFNSTHSLTTKTLLDLTVDRASAIALLHDHTAFQKLQPLFVGNKDNPTPTEWLATEATTVAPADVEPDYRAVIVRVPFGPFGSSDVITMSAFIDTEDGLIIVFQAPMGLYGQNKWSIIAAEDGEGFVLLEEARLTGLAPMMPFIIMTEKQSHTEQGKAIAQKVKGN